MNPLCISPHQPVPERVRRLANVIYMAHFPTNDKAKAKRLHRVLSWLEYLTKYKAA